MIAIGVAIAIVVSSVVVGFAMLVYAWVFVTHARAWRHHARMPARLPLARAVWNDVVEGVAIMRVRLWALTGRYRARVWNAERPSAEPLVLCLHGFSQGCSSMWGLRRALHRSGRDSYAMTMGVAFRRLERYMPRLERAFEELHARGYASIGVVAHSMGGLILRLVLAKRPRYRALVRRVVTLGTPHHGTAGARAPALAPEIKQMQLESQDILALPTLTELLPEALITTISAPRDCIVYPEWVCHQPRSQRVSFEHVGHVGLLCHPRVIESVVSALGSDQG